MSLGKLNTIKNKTCLGKCTEDECAVIKSSVRKMERCTCVCVYMLAHEKC